MFQLLYQYFILHKKVGIPGIGVFYIKRRPAQYHFNNKEFVAPAASITFSTSTFVTDEKWLTFLSKQHQVDEAEAKTQFIHFAENLQNELQANGSVELPGFGVLSQTESGIIFSGVDGAIPTFLMNVPVEKQELVIEAPQPVLTQPLPDAHPNVEIAPVEASIETETRNNRSYWLIAAAVLAVVAIAAIIYYYQQNGSFR